MNCSCHHEANAVINNQEHQTPTQENLMEVIPGAERVVLYYPKLKGKRVALVVNQTSTVENVHLVDTLRSMNVDIVSIFAPEHGFRGKADAGERVSDQVDARTGIPIISLYGKKKGPSPDDLKNVDIVVFDIQDVGARFYTYISTLHYVMEACAEADLPVILLDRPNPNAAYIDGPVLEEEFSSFVGMHPVPIVYGMTIGEYGKMINGEAWLKNGVQCDLEVIPCKYYTHDTYYNLPQIPSPNLPNIQSIFLYPSLCLFEGTHVSVGRGTDMQFQMYGHPAWTETEHQVMIRSTPGAKYPKHQDQKIGYRSLQHLTKQGLHDRREIDMSYILEMHRLLTAKGEPFFLDNNFFEKLAGTDRLRQQIEAGMTADEIRKSWQPDLDEFNLVRQKYLLYE